MLFKTVPISQVLARLFRIRFFDASVAKDLIEWVGEGLEKLEVSESLTPRKETLYVKKYLARIPCGLAESTALIYNGQRLRYGTSDIDTVDAAFLSDPAIIDDAIFITDATLAVQNTLGSRISGSDLTPVDNSKNAANWYKIQLDYFQFSFCEGEVKLYYKQRPVDEKGYPLIPDNENLKTALFWYLIYMLNMAGFEFPKKEMNDLEYCRVQFETYGRRAMNEIKSYNMDRAETSKQMNTRMITPYSFYSDFFTNSEQYASNSGL